MQFAHEHRSFARRIFNRLRFVERNHRPTVRIEKIGVSVNESVRRNDDRARNFEVFCPVFVALRAVVAMMNDDVNRRRKPQKLAFPVADNAHGTNEQDAAAVGRIAFDHAENVANELDRFAESHIVGQAASKPQARLIRQPRDAALLVRAERPAERIGRFERHVGDVFLCQTRQNIGDFAFDDDFDVGIGGIRVGNAGQGAVDRVKTRYHALRFILVDEQFDVAQLNGIDEHPFAVPLDEGLFERDDFAKFFCRYDFVAQSGFPAEAGNFAQAEPTARRVCLIGVADAETRPQAARTLVGELRRKTHVESRRTKQRADFGDECPRLPDIEKHAFGLGLFEALFDRFKILRGFSQIGQEAFLRVVERMMIDSELFGADRENNAGTDGNRRIFDGNEHIPKKPHIVGFVGRRFEPKSGPRIDILRRVDIVDGRGPIRNRFDEHRIFEVIIDAGTRFFVQERVDPAAFPARERIEFLRRGINEFLHRHELSQLFPGHFHGKSDRDFAGLFDARVGQIRGIERELRRGRFGDRMLGQIIFGRRIRLGGGSDAVIADFFDIVDRFEIVEPRNGAHIVRAAVLLRRACAGIVSAFWGRDPIRRSRQCMMRLMNAERRRFVDVDGAVAVRCFGF